MITDARVLKPEFVPREVQYRDAEVNHLSTALEPVERGEPAETAILLGPSGAGKTCIARFAVERLREEVIDVETAYVNCWQDYTRFRALYTVLDAVDRAIDVHRQSTPEDELVERLRAYDGPPFVVILDEADQLQDEAVFYDLYRSPGVSMILIANREEPLLHGLDDRLHSRLHSATRIRFDGYGIDELVAILADRVRWGLDTDAVDESLLEEIADAAAGDARAAIGILRNAARRADRDGREQITPDDVETAVPETRSELQREAEERLTTHQQTLYEIVADYDEVDPGTLYDEYATRVDDPKTRRTVRNYLAKLQQYDLVEAIGENRAAAIASPSRIASSWPPLSPPRVGSIRLDRRLSEPEPTAALPDPPSAKTGHRSR